MNEYRRYHLTPVENARQILENGFCECGNRQHHPGSGARIGTPPRSGLFADGIWVSDRPLQVHQYFIPRERWTLDGEHGSAQLEIVIKATSSWMNDHEWKETPLFREWLFQAPELNERIVNIRKLTMREKAEILGEPVYSMLEYQRLREDDFALSSIVAGNPLKALAELMKVMKKG